MDEVSWWEWNLHTCQNTDVSDFFDQFTHKTEIRAFPAGVAIWVQIPRGEGVRGVAYLTTSTSVVS